MLIHRLGDTPDFGGSPAVLVWSGRNLPPKARAFSEAIETASLRRERGSREAGGETGTMGLLKKNRNCETNLPSAAFY